LSSFIGILLGIVFLVLAVRDLKVDELRAALQAADYTYLLPAGFLSIAALVVRSFRWRGLLEPTKKISAWRLFPVLVIGFAMNLIFPARAGEFGRAHLVGRREGLSRSLSFATIVVERIVDGLMLVGMLVSVTLAFNLPGWAGDAARGGLALFGLALASVVLLLLREEWALKLLTWGLRFLPTRLAAPLQRMVTSFIEGLRVLRGAPGIVRLILISFLVWACEVAVIYVLLLGFKVTLPFEAMLGVSMFFLCIVGFTTILPAAPGSLGMYEFFGMTALTVFGLKQETAFSLAVISHLLPFVLLVSLGAFFIWRENLSLTGLGQAVEQKE